MILIPDSLSFDKLVMMSSAPAKSAGIPDMRPMIHLFVDRLIDCPTQSWLQSVLGVHSFYVYVRRTQFKYMYMYCSDFGFLLMNSY